MNTVGDITHEAEVAGADDSSLDLLTPSDLTAACALSTSPCLGASSVVIRNKKTECTCISSHQCYCQFVTDLS